MDHPSFQERIDVTKERLLELSEICPWAYGLAKNDQVVFVDRLADSMPRELMVTLDEVAQLNTGTVVSIGSAHMRRDFILREARNSVAHLSRHAKDFFHFYMGPVYRDDFPRFAPHPLTVSTVRADISKVMGNRTFDQAQRQRGAIAKRVTGAVPPGKKAYDFSSSLKTEYLREEYKLG